MLGTFLLLLVSAAGVAKLSDPEARQVREAQLAEAIAYARQLEAQAAFRDATVALTILVDKLRPKDCPGCDLDPATLTWKPPQSKGAK